ncbi:putative sodium-dependent multivitamin transporter isoform X2 [Cephus cinctus]|uniref:Sodium-dependent multivitamin transporter isoform X2 n=1 Tax=Cephus cinctus TaxID=211228 RepID=A0AAJ7W6V1_CEPCN|nr:putative sodium-dependent multivitamin transporter isoform X2 [Cephus cinctus]
MKNWRSQLRVCRGVKGEKKKRIEEMSSTLVIADYVVIVMMLLVSSGIGVYYRITGGRQRTTEEYFAANRSMSVTTVAIALMASYLSAISLLGVSSENYVYGTQYAVVNIGYGLATPVVAHLYLPVFFKLQATSAFELLLYTGVVLYAPALALEATTGLSSTASILGIGLICTFYSTLGGIKAVLVTDVFQSLLMLVAVLTIIVTAAIHAGGLDRIWDTAYDGSRVEFTSLSLDPTVRHTWWSLVIGGFFTYLSLFGANQVQVQRMLTVKNLRSAQKAIWWSWPLASVMSLVSCFSGLAIYARYKDCDPLSSGRITSNDQLMPLFVMDTLSRYPGIPGLFIAGIFSAGLSTVSATLNSLAVVVLEDYAKPLCKMRGSEISSNVSTLASKIIAIVVGLLCITMAFFAQYLGGVLQAALTIFAVVGGPVLGLFTLGMCTRYATQRGAVTGLLIGLAFSMWIGFGQPKPSPPRLPVSTAGCNETYVSDGATANFERAQSTGDSTYFYLYRISYMWYCPLGFIVCILFGLLGSGLFRLIFKENNENLHPNLYMSVGTSRQAEVLGRSDEVECKNET